MTKQQRCRTVALAIALGIVLPIVERSWVALGAALAGIAILGVLYWRDCWRDS
jgi:hypothetical protein